jgi:drug/metabolite transporter (DMT)-like permease
MVRNKRPYSRTKIILQNNHYK